MWWHSYWMEDTDAKDGSGWVAIDLLMPNPEVKGGPLVLLAGKCLAFRRCPAEEKMLAVVTAAKVKILATLRKQLDDVEKTV